MLYLYLILGANLAIIAANLIINLFFPSIFLGYSIAYILLMPPVCTVAVIAVDGIAAFVIRRLPEKYFVIGSKFCDVSKRECDFYVRLGIRKWREKIPELGFFTGFHKNRVAEPSSNEYLERFIMEANYGAVIHLMGVPFGLLIIFLCPIAHAPFITLPVATVNAALNFMPAFVLRYNVPRLCALHRRNLRKEIK